jgi:hypothetical protein
MLMWDEDESTNDVNNRTYSLLYYSLEQSPPWETNQFSTN